MSVASVRKLRGDETVVLLRELVAELRGLRSDLRRREVDASALVEALLVEIEDYFGIGGRFTAGGLLKRAEQDERMANALAGVIDMNLEPHARATSLGLLLRRVSQIQAVATRAGATVYELRARTRDP